MAQSFDEVEDLTRFADESFDTDDIDLFEFTGDDDSPLTRLKSIILSLDWEISDDILDELAEEVASLGEMWKDDKVAQVYLQGMDKVGKYLRVEGAYAHPNAIKLLLTLFYNYEKIISSPDITGDEITTLLKADIRKFKVLQYQIARTKGISVAPAQETPAAETGPEEECEPLTGMEATILGLDWEVTDEGLEKFTRQAEALREHLADNQHALVLVQGLQAIGAYISDEKANAHPDAFTLMHSFYDGLKTLVNGDLDVDARQELIIEHVSSLNTLKEIIAGNVPTPAVADQDSRVDEILDFKEEPEEEAAEQEGELELDEQETPAPAEAEEEEAPAGGDELDFDFGIEDIESDQPAAMSETPDEESPATPVSDADEFEIELDEEVAPRVNAAMETADEQYPDDVLDPAAIQPVTDEIADEFIEEELSFTAGAASAMAEDTQPALDMDTTETDTDVEEELELLFAGTDEDEEISLETPESEGEELELDFEAELTEEEETEGPDLAEALAQTDQEDDDLLDFDQDLFVTEDEDTEEETVTPALADADEDEAAEDFNLSSIGEESASELEGKLDSFFGLDEEESEPAVESADETGDDSIAPALADEDEESGFSEELASQSIGEEPSAELEDKLDSFFGLDEEEPDIETGAQETAPEETADMEDDTVVAALADVDEEVESGFREEAVVASLDEDPSADIEGKLDAFFGEDTPAAEEEGTEEAVALFDEDATVPALADADEESGFSEERAVADLEETPADISDKLDSFFGEDTEEEKGLPAAELTALSSVAAAAAAFAATPSRERAAEIAEIAALGKKEDLTDNQLVLLELMDSASRILADHPQLAADNSEIVTLLASDVENSEQPGVLVAAVGRYTAWQQEVFKQAAAAPAPAGTAPTVAGEEIVEQVSAGFEQLRESIRQEFENLRKELG